MAKVDIWMPIYIGDYLRDTEELSATEHGAYILLLMHYWLKNGKIGCDIGRLSRVAKTDEITARFILGNYFSLVNGNYINKRADIEIKNANNRRLSATENGKKGGRPSRNNPEKTDGLTGGLPTDNRAGNPQKSSSPSPSPIHISIPEDNIRGSPTAPRVGKSVFVKPTIEEVKAYCIERQNTVDPERWYAHYESNGWKVGKNPMKDWRSAVRTWENSKFNKSELKVNQRSSFLEMEE